MLLRDICRYHITQVDVPQCNTARDLRSRATFVPIVLTQKHAMFESLCAVVAG